MIGGEDFCQRETEGEGDLLAGSVVELVEEVAADFGLGQGSNANGTNLRQSSSGILPLRVANKWLEAATTLDYLP